MKDTKSKSTFAKVTKIVIWVMLILMVGSVFIGALAYFM
ncbi:DUF4044 domain-containing protein [Enterococcus phoeniculicola]|jgi:cell division septal protein FtsQ|uniref:DUF4044 domain-containing protein n=1 Tax=Enterococcus phoeniculicola ATCC BAA-412 TaxID=1158610 RepID=R3WM70_9ENTE|nr:DUF4044 domain-containing protein [Enterococcus phoeniculicola]EOL48926.1 hypothetical protein UC3_00478 [Enterococcus phoeniculicola ATCC BAA-412]EOT72772.1 hypothetical protein I589_03042 [Enterococcus phoeniculicola ATCC BAA-412]